MELAGADALFRVTVSGFFPDSGRKAVLRRAAGSGPVVSPGRLRIKRHFRFCGQAARRAQFGEQAPPVARIRQNPQVVDRSLGHCVPVAGRRNSCEMAAPQAILPRKMRQGTGNRFVFETVFPKLPGTDNAAAGHEMRIAAAACRDPVRAQGRTTNGIHPRYLQFSGISWKNSFK